MFKTRSACPLILWGIASALTWPLVAAAQAPSREVPTRDQIPEKYKWNLEAIYATSEAWEADFKRCEQMIVQVEQRKGSLGHSAQDLFQALELNYETFWLKDKLLVYAFQRSHEDTGNSAALGPKGHTETLSVAYDKATSWIRPELLTIPEDTLRRWCAEHDGLSVYTHYLDDVIRSRTHTLPAREEELLAMVGNLAGSPGNAFGVLNNAELIYPTIQDETGEDVQLSPSRFNKYVRSSDRRVRRDAFAGCMQAYKSFENTIAATLNGAVQRDLFFAQARGFDSCLAASFFPDNLPVSVHTTLVDTINRNLPALHRWASVRKKTAKLDELHVYDLYQPVVEGVAREIEYDEAVKTILEALAPLGPEYCATAKKGFESRWVDVYETKGKRSGAYSWGSYDTQPFVLLNYNKTLKEMGTIAHELGHSMHSYATHKHQPKVYGKYSYFVAEVASTFNELLLQDYLLANTTDRKEQLYLLNHAINGICQSVFRQTMFSEFEVGIHEMAERGEPLTADSMGKLYVDIFHKYWGPQLVRDANHAPYWGRIPHFYRNFYVYRYATAYCAAAALAEGVLKKKPGALEAYHGFLRAGSSDDPLEILRKAGVDMNTPAPVEAAMRRFAQLVETMEQRLAE